MWFTAAAARISRSTPAASTRPKGTVQNDARGQAERMLELCCDLASGAEPSPERITDGHYVWLWYTAVTRENLAGFLPE